MMQPSFSATLVKDKSKPPTYEPKTYITRQVASSIALLQSPEDDVVLEALIYLSKYADLHVNNLNYLRQHGLVQKLLNLIKRNVCIVRLTLRFLGILLTIEDVLIQSDNSIYDEKILEIADMYISHTDSYVREYCVSVLSKLTTSCRITCLIFKIELFNPILDTITHTRDMDLLEWTLELFLRLLNSPAALPILPDIYNFDTSILMTHLENPEKKIAYLSFEVIHTLTYYCLDVFQRMFREAKLIERMFSVIINDKKQEFHHIAFDIITNSMKSEETSDYFIESLEFLKFCQWVNKCDEKYLYSCIIILEQLTTIPSRRQILFDLSVEDSIISCLRSRNKKVLNKTCEAISNMTLHKHCCEQMLRPSLLKDLFRILVRKDEEDPGNEVALKTIIDFSRRNLNTLDIIHTLGLYKVLLGYFKRGAGFISEESFLGILEILYKMSMHPEQQKDIVSTSFFEKLLQLFQTAPVNIISFVCEIFTNFLGSENFRSIFLSLDGPNIFVKSLQTSTNMIVLKNVLIFIYGNLIHHRMVERFLEDGIVKVLKEFPEYLKTKAPIAEKILKLIYNLHLPLKLYETNRLEITDKLESKFYLIDGLWRESFPLGLQGVYPISTMYTIYVVDYSYEWIDSVVSDTTWAESNSSQRTLSTLSSPTSSFKKGHIPMNYGKLSPDPFLPKYITHIRRYIEAADTMEEKIKLLAEYIDALLCENKEGFVTIEKVHNFKLHVQILKYELGTNIVPIGFLRLGFHCERALHFKAIADKCCIPTSLVKGTDKIYWNEVTLFDTQRNHVLVQYVVDLVNNIGNLLVVGSRAANEYCHLKE